MTLLIEVQVVGVMQLIIDSHRADEPPKVMTHRLGILANRVLEAVAALDQRKNIVIQRLVVIPVESQSVASRKNLVVDLVAHRLMTILTGDRMVAGDAGTSSYSKHRERLDELTSSSRSRFGTRTVTANVRAIVVSPNRHRHCVGRLVGPPR